MSLSPFVREREPAGIRAVVGALGRARPRAAAQRRGRGYWLRLSAVTFAALVLGYAAISMRYAEDFSRPVRAAVGDPASVAQRHEAVAFRARDGVLLRGWLFRASADRAVIVVHGRNGARSGETETGVARMLLAAGHSVLLFDLRGHGESEGERFSLGQHERHDVAAAVDHLVSLGFRPERVALLGISMGAGTVLQAVAVRADVGPVIADSSFLDGRTIVDEVGPSVTGLPVWFNPGMLLVARLLFGVDVDAASPIAVVRAHPERPYLFINCALDKTVGPHHARALRAASPHPASELWVAPDCGHVQAFAKHREEYARRVLGFLEAQLR